MKKDQASGWWPWIVAGLALVCIALFVSILPHPLAVDDGLRHVAMARLYIKHGMGTVGWNEFFYQGYFHSVTVDPWFLSDALLMPLVSFGAVNALRIFTVLSIAALLASFLLILRWLKIGSREAASLVVLLLCGDGLFLLRILVGRPFVLLTAITLLMLLSILSKRSTGAGIILTLSVLLSQLFVFPMFVWLVGVMWLCSIKDWRNASRFVVIGLLGLLLGFALHPQTVEYLQYLVDVFVRIPFLSIGLGTEMMSGFAALPPVLVAFGFLILLHASAVSHGVSLRRMHESGLLLTYVLIIFFGGAFILWMRAIDILWPLICIAAAQLLYLSPDCLRSLVHRVLPKASVRPVTVVGIMVLIVQVVSCMIMFVQANPSHRLQIFADALSVIPSQSKVLDMDWDVFPAYVSVRPDILYATGIDPSFTALVDAQGYKLFIQPVAEHGESDDSLFDEHQWIADMLHTWPSDYIVLLSVRHEHLIASLRTDSHLVEQGSGGQLTVFKVR